MKLEVPNSWYMVSVSDLFLLNPKSELDDNMKVGFIPMVKGYWKTLLLGCGTRWVDGTFYNIFIVWILSYCINWLGMPLIQTYIITIIACIFKIPFTLFGGWCAQKLGNTRTFVIGALATLIVFAGGLNYSNSQKREAFKEKVEKIIITDTEFVKKNDCWLLGRST